MPLLVLFALFFAVTVSSQQDPTATYACSREITGLSQNNMGFKNMLEWTYDDANKTLSIHLVVVGRLGWAGIGFTRKEYAGMDKASYQIGYLHSDGVMHEKGCVNAYTGSGNNHPVIVRAPTTLPLTWSVSMGRQSNELLDMRFKLDTRTLPFAFEVTNTKVLVAMHYSSSTFGIECPLDKSLLPMHKSLDNKAPNVALEIDWSTYNGRKCNGIVAPTVAPTPNPPQQTNGPSPAPTVAPTPQPNPPQQTNGPSPACQLGQPPKLTFDAACKATAAFQQYDANAQLCYVEQCRCIDGVMNTMGQCTKEPTCAQLSCSTKKYQCVMNEIRKVSADPACTSALAPLFTSTTTECTREVCSVPQCSASQYTDACTGVTATTGVKSGATRWAVGMGLAAVAAVVVLVW